MATKEVFHVVLHGKSWAVRRQSNEDIRIFDTKMDAIDHAERRARETKPRSEVLIYGLHGQVFQKPIGKLQFSEKAVRNAVRAVIAQRDNQAQSQTKIHKTLKNTLPQQIA